MFKQLISLERLVGQAELTVIQLGQHPQCFGPVWAALVRLLRPKVVVDIGTNTGLSALSLRQYLPEGGVVYTFDVLPWAGIPHTCLRREDFEDGRMIQVVADLAQPKAADAHRDKLLSAPLIFVDGPKDGVFEPAFLKNLARMPFANQAYLVFDDIKDHNMLDIWREIKEPKMDITSLGHWLGTGIVHWPAGKATS